MLLPEVPEGVRAPESLRWLETCPGKVLKMYVGVQLWIERRVPVDSTSLDVAEWELLAKVQRRWVTQGRMKVTEDSIFHCVDTVSQSLVRRHWCAATGLDARWRKFVPKA